MNSATNFNVMVMRAVTELFRNYPKPITIDNDVILSPPLKVNDPDYRERQEASSTTCRWLIDNRIALGTPLDSVPLNEPQVFAIWGAQLSQSAWKILSKAEGKNDLSLGQIALASLSGQSEASTAALVMKRLTGD